jgi:hypothetical protein
VSVAIFDVSAIIFVVVSGVAAGAIVDVSVDIVDVESLVVSVVEEPPLQAAKNAEMQTITNNFFILINLDFYNLFYVYTYILKR